MLIVYSCSVICGKRRSGMGESEKPYTLVNVCVFHKIHIVTVSV